MIKKSWLIFLVALLLTSTIVTAGDYLFPGAFEDNSFWIVSIERDDAILPCLGMIEIGSDAILVSPEGEEHPTEIIYGPHFFSETFMNRWRIGAAGLKLPEELLGEGWQLKLTCETETVNCVDQLFYRDDDGVEEEKLPGFAYGIYEDELQRVDNICEDDIVTQAVCSDDNISVEIVNLECPAGCAGAHCAPVFVCIDSDIDEEDFTVIAGFVNITRYDEEYNETISIAESLDVCDTRALTEYYCEDETATEATSVVIYCDPECADEGSCMTPEVVIDWDNISGCCLNKLTEPCRYYDSALECCPVEGYEDVVDTFAPQNQEECLADFFFESDNAEACAEMGPEDAENYRLCEKGCCCEYTTAAVDCGPEEETCESTLTVTAANQLSSVACAVIEGHRAYYTFETIETCSIESCSERLGGIAENQPPVFELLEGQIDVCLGDEVKFDVQAIDADSDFLIYSTGVLPEGATFQQKTIPQYVDEGYSSEGYVFTWTPSEVESVTLNFSVTDNLYEVSQGVVINISDCNPVTISECKPMTPPNNNTICLGDKFSFCLGMGEISADSLPEGATFNQNCFEWEPTEEGQYTVTFVKEDCEEPLNQELFVQDCDNGLGEWIKGLFIGAGIAAIIVAILAFIVWKGVLTIVWFGISLATAPLLFMSIFVAIGAIVGALVWGLL